MLAEEEGMLVFYLCGHYLYVCVCVCVFVFVFVFVSVVCVSVCGGVWSRDRRVFVEGVDEMLSREGGDTVIISSKSAIYSLQHLEFPAGLSQEDSQRLFTSSRYSTRPRRFPMILGLYESLIVHCLAFARLAEVRSN